MGIAPLQGNPIENPMLGKPLWVRIHISKTLMI